MCVHVKYGDKFFQESPLSLDLRKLKYYYQGDEKIKTHTHVE